jgi:2-polyprenyl-3-methyl-5-hydroxy-6-metoxy-1,4-benzoquinol methylase
MKVIADDGCPETGTSVGSGTGSCTSLIWEVRALVEQRHKLFRGRNLTEHRSFGQEANGVHQHKVDETYNAAGDGWLKRYLSEPSFQARLVHVSGEIASLLQPNASATVLDFGGGAGTFSAIASSSASRVLCLDRAQIMLRAALHDDQILVEIAQTVGVTYHPERVIRVVGDLRSLTYTAGPQFDLVMAIAVLEYTADVTTTVSALAALIRPGGHLLVTVPNPRSPVRMWQQLRLRMAAAALRVGVTRGAGLLAYEELRPFGSKVPLREALDCVGVSVLRVSKIPQALRGPRRWTRPNLVVVAQV